MTVRCSLGHENPDGAGCRDECGEPLSGAARVDAAGAPQGGPPVAAPQAGTEICPSCGAVNPAGEAFCSNCGSMLGAPAAVASAPAPAVSTAAPAASVATAVPAVLTARLIVEADNQEFDLSGKDTIVIGREDAVSNIFPDVDLTPHGGEEGGVSRLHARIFFDYGQDMLGADNSTNFTFLQRQKLTAKTPTPLHHHHEINLGRILLPFKQAS